MAQCKPTPYEFIQNAFPPIVAVLSSPLADQICQKNNLSFIEMVQPFCQLSSDVHFRDPSGTSVAVKNLKICLRDVHSRPPQPTLARKFLNESVSSASCDVNSTMVFGEHSIEVPVATPWFDAWRETFLQVQFPSDHEFTKHYLACVLVISTAEASPIDAVRSLRSQLQSLQAVSPGKLPKWMSTPSPPLSFYLLLHDAIEGDSAKAENTLTAMKAEYGANTCFLLTINSRPPGQSEDLSHLPDPWSQYLTKHRIMSETLDHDNSPHTPVESTNAPVVGSRSGLDEENTLEIGQEASTFSPVPVTEHPLSPQEEEYYSPLKESGKPVGSNSSILNSNVWLGITPVSTPSNPNCLQPHGSCLTAPDLDRIRAFVHDMCAHALLPHIEKQIQQLNDQISNKKSASRFLLGATKRLFGANKPGSVASSIPTNAVIYSCDAPELQLRRLGDLCFMFRHYKIAFEAYHSAKRDFAADGAWLYYAGALEMASLSAFMMGESSRKTQEYSEEAILTYLNTCRMPQFATRGTLLSTECLKSRALFGEAARQLIRMTSDDSDLRSALLLEHAAYCFLQASRPAMLRKFAFHMVFAGHRFSKAGQRKHSLRCYQQAYQVYKGKGWNLAEDHIHFTIGRQAASLRQTELAVQSLSRLFTPYSKQSSVQQAAFLKEFLTTHQQLCIEKGLAGPGTSLPVLPLPIIDNASLCLLLGPVPPLGEQTDSKVIATGTSFKEDPPEVESIWLQLEEKLLTEAKGSPPLIFKPALALFTSHSDNTNRPCAVLGEPVSVAVTVKNPLGISLILKDVHLLWSFQPIGKDGTSDNNESWICNEKVAPNENDKWIQTSVLSTLSLEPNISQQVVLSVIPRCMGNLRIVGMAYNIIHSAVQDTTANNSITIESPTSSSSLSVQGKQIFVMEMKKAAFSVKKPGTVDKKTEDNRFNVMVVEAAPQLKVQMNGLLSEMLCGELQKVELEMSNVGAAPIKSLLIGTNTPHLFSIAELPHQGSNIKSSLQVQKVPLDDVLLPGQKCSLTMWVRSPDIQGTTSLQMLFYYDGASTDNVRYRLVRHLWPITVLESVHISAEAKRSHALNDKEVLNFGFRIANANKVKDLLLTKVTLVQLSMASKLWALQSTPVSLSQQETVLDSQESVLLLMQAVRSDQKNELVFSDKPMNKIDNELLSPSSSRPYQDFLFRHGDFLSTVLSDDGSTTSTALNVKATIILRWKAVIKDSGGATRTAFGQHHLTVSNINKRFSCPEIQQPISEQAPTPLKVFGPDRNVPSEYDLNVNKGVIPVEVMQQLVAYCLQHPPLLVHDFSKRRLCIVNVKLLLHNCCDSPLSVKVNMASSSGGMPSKSQLYLPHASSLVRWVGRLVSHVELAARSSETLPLCVAITAPGTYNLGAHLQIWCRMIGSPENMAIAQRLRLESAIVVSNAGSNAGDCCVNTNSISSEVCLIESK